MKEDKAVTQLLKRYQQTMAELYVAQTRATALDAVSRQGEFEDQALLALHHALAQVDYARHALDIAEFDQWFDAEIGHVLDDHPSALPLSLAVARIGEILVSRGYSFRIEF